MANESGSNSQRSTKESGELYKRQRAEGERRAAFAVENSRTSNAERVGLPGGRPGSRSK
jgi:hypothetical protein